MDEYQELANEILDEVSDYFHDKYGITYKDIKEKKGLDDGVSEEDRALIYGEDYYYFEDLISEKLKEFVQTQSHINEIEF